MQVRVSGVQIVAEVADQSGGEDRERRQQLLVAQEFSSSAEGLAKLGERR